MFSTSLTAIFVSMTLAFVAFAAAMLLAQKNGRKDQALFLAGFLGLYGAIKLDELFLLAGGYAAFPHLLGLTFSLKLFLGPLIYFYTRALTSPEPRWASLADWPALAAPLIAIGVAAPFYMLSSEDKLALMAPEARDPKIYANALLGCRIGFGLFLASSLSYLYATQRLFTHHADRLRDLFSRIDDKTIDWLRWIILILAVGWTGHGISEISAISGSRPDYAVEINQLFELLWIGAMAFFGVQQQVAQAAWVPELARAEHDPSRARRSSLDAQRMAAVANRLDRAMSQQNLFLNPDLSLRDLSDAVGVSENHVSATFSARLGLNFFDFVNGYRVARARELLEAGDATILDIAYASGFNSRSTFNAAFRKHVGMTPSQYRKGQRAPHSAESVPYGP